MNLEGTLAKQILKVTQVISVLLFSISCVMGTKLLLPIIALKNEFRSSL